MVSGLVALSSGCGHRGARVAPLPRVPETPREVVWRQVGDRLEARASFVLSAIGGRSLRPPVRPVLLILPATTPALASGWGSPGRAREYARLATPIMLEPLDETTGEKTVSASISVPVGQLGGADVVVVALAVADARDGSMPSDRRSIRLARPALERPARLSLDEEERGIRLAWTAPTDDRVAAAVVYRIQDGSDTAWEPWRVVPADQQSAFDDSASYGGRYRYELAWSSDVGAPIVQSERVRAPEVGFLEYTDVYAPLPPRQIDAVAETERIRVFWFEGGSEDEREVVVERQTEGEGGFREIGRVAVPDAWFEDRLVEQSVRYRYQAYGVDGNGNASERAGPTGWVSPRPARDRGP
jgi:hypothetical protein